MSADLDMFAARTQARITYTLLGMFGGLMFSLLIVACLPVHADDKLTAILDRIVTAMLPIVGGAVGFWVARHRSQNGAEDAEPTPIVPPPETKP